MSFLSAWILYFINKTRVKDLYTVCNLLRDNNFFKNNKFFIGNDFENIFCKWSSNFLLLRYRVLG